MAKAKKLKSGNWRCLVYDYTDENGKRHYESFTAETKKEAEYLAAEFLLKKGEKKKKEKYEDITLTEAIDRYIASEDAILSPTTIAGYRKIQRNRFKGLMSLKISEIDNDILKHAVNEEMKIKGRNGKQLSPKTIKNSFGLITATLGWYAPDFKVKVPLPQTSEKIIELIDAKTIMKLVQGSDIELPVLLAMWLSFSMSEIRGLTKSKSIRGDYIAVEEVVVDVENKAVRKDKPKTISRVRLHRIPPYIKKLIDDVEGDVIVPMTRYNIYYRFTSMLERVGLPHMTFHQLRHLNASIMAALNIPDKYAQERGGWKTDRVMKKVYTHTFSEERQNVDNKIDSYFENIMQHEMQHTK